MSNQTINITMGEVRYTLPRTVKAGPTPDGQPVDISTDQVQVSLGTDTDIGADGWMTPDTVLHPAPDTVVVELLIGDQYVPALGRYRLWVRVTDNPEVVPRCSPDVIVIV